VNEAIFAGLTTFSLAITIVCTAILVMAALQHRDNAVLRERAGVSIGLTCLYLLGYVILLGRNVVSIETIYLVAVGMVLALLVPQLYFLYLYITRRW
jgi:hypothetical protein